MRVFPNLVTFMYVVMTTTTKKVSIKQLAKQQNNKVTHTVQFTPSCTKKEKKETWKIHAPKKLVKLKLKKNMTGFWEKGQFRSHNNFSV